MERNSKEMVETVIGKSNFIRVSADFPSELYIGHNDMDRPTLRLYFEETHMPLKGTEIIEVRQSMVAGKNAISFSLKNREFAGLFFNFCDDIIEILREIPARLSYQEIIKRYASWKRLFRDTKGEVFNEAQIKGLIGELLFLKDFSLKNFSDVAAINGWSGPIPTHKDFVYGDNWYEIKTTSYGKKTVNISSVEQLDSDKDGELVVVEVERMSIESNGISLNKMIQNITMLIEDDDARELFHKILIDFKYKYSDEYDYYVYEVRKITSFVVTKTFPCFRRTSVPEAVDSLKYSLNLNLLSDFKKE